MKIDLSKNKNQAAFFDAVMQAVAGQSGNRFFAYGGAIRGGKALCINTPIPTPNGWTTMGELKEGDEVIGADGKPDTVTYSTPVQYGNKCFLVRFSDGSEIIADADHQWVTLTQKERNSKRKHTDEFRSKRRSTRPKRGKGLRPDLALRNSKEATSKPFQYPETRTTQQILDTIDEKHGVETHAGFDLCKKELPVPPYTLGAWLGDGVHCHGCIFGNDAELKEIGEHIQNEGFLIKHYPERISCTVYGLISKIKKAGLYKNKHIPSEYLRASHEQRLALLQGIVDTDGYVCERGHVEITLTSKQLSYGVLELIRTFGIKATIRKSKARLNGRVISDRYRIKFITSLPVARLKRKVLRLKELNQRPFYIESITPVSSVPVKCITVSREMYLCGEAMIPTHNTFVTLFILIILARKFPGSRWHVIRKDLPSLKATTIPSFEKLVPPDVKIHRDPGNYRAEFPNKSQIFFKPESLNQDPELKDFLGLETNGIFLEQAEELSETMHNRAKERTGSWYIDPMPPGFIFYTFNPTDEWVRDVFYEPNKRGDLKEPYYYREALPTDNPYVTADQWAAWDEMDDTLKAQMVLGDWDARRTDNQFYYGFSRAKHVAPVTIDPALPVHLSFDQNVLPYITLTCWQIQETDGNKTAVQFDEFCLAHPNNTTEALCKAFMDKYGEVFSMAFLYGDASGNKRDTRANVTDYAIAKRVLRPLLNNRSDRTLKSNPSVTKRREWENNLLNNKYNIRVLIDPACKNSISDLVNTPTDENGHKLKKRVKGANGETFEKYGHTSDTMDYVLTTVFAREFARYLNNRFSISS